RRRAGRGAGQGYAARGTNRRGSTGGGHRGRVAFVGDAQQPAVEPSAHRSGQGVAGGDVDEPRRRGRPARLGGRHRGGLGGDPGVQVGQRLGGVGGGGGVTL